MKISVLPQYFCIEYILKSALEYWNIKDCEKSVMNGARHFFSKINKPEVSFILYSHFHSSHPQVTLEMGIQAFFPLGVMWKNQIYADMLWKSLDG